VPITAGAYILLILQVETQLLYIEGNCYGLMFLFVNDIEQDVCNGAQAK
jgi:hypothetical protein